MEFGLQLVVLFQKILFSLTLPIFWVLSLWPGKKLPPIKNEILYQSATSLARQIRSGKLTSVQVVGAYVARIQEVNPLLNAVVQQRFDAALDDARRVDALVASGRRSEQQMETETPFLGVPITIKESCSLKGMSFSVGSLPRKGVVADSDGVTVALVLNSGAIPLAVTNTPELCYSWESDNLITGRTRNPYDTLRTSGGSSGGEGALLGAAASVIGLGSDLAGSIRIPALFNGIFGHKPTPDIVSIAGHFPTVSDPNYRKYGVLGPMARYAEDLAPMLHVMAGPLAHTLRLHEEVDVTSLKVFYMTEAYWSLIDTPVDSEIKSILQKAVNYLQTDCRLETKKLHLKEMKDSYGIGLASLSGLKEIPNLVTYHLEESTACKKPPNLVIEFVKSLFGMSVYSHLVLAYYSIVTSGVCSEENKSENYPTKREELRNIFVDLLKEDGVFLYPTQPTPAIYHNQSYFMSSNLMYSMLFNVLSLPSTHVPLGLNKQGLPIGIQVIAAPYQDRLCLAVAKQLEAKFGGWIPPPST